MTYSQVGPNSSIFAAMPFATAADLPSGVPDGTIAVVLDDDQLYIYDLVLDTWDVVSGGGGGVPTTLTISTTAPLTGGGDLSADRTLAINQSSGSQDGYLSSTDWNTFDSKVDRTGDTMSGALLADGGIDVTPTGGTDTLAIGTSNADIINIGRSGATVNVQGTTAFQNVTNYVVADKNITTNSGGSAGSGSNAGLDVEEGASITGYAKTSGDRNSWTFKAPNAAGVATITAGALGITLDQSSHNPVTIGTANGLSLSTQELSLAAATSGTTGALTSSDWSTFNNKEPAISSGTTSQYWRGDKSFQTLNTAALAAVTDGSSAASGKVNELIEGSTALSTTNVAASGSWGYAHTQSLTAGRWLVYGVAQINENSAVLVDSVAVAVSTSANPGSVAFNYAMQMPYISSGGSDDPVISSPPRILNLSATTDVYCNTKIGYSSGSPRHAGAIFAVRIG
jgi:hypothetical protein